MSIIPPGQHCESPVCGCGNPVKYYVNDGSMSCNQYFRCSTYDEIRDLLIQTNNQLIQLRNEYAKLLDQVKDQENDGK